MRNKGLIATIVIMAAVIITLIAILLVIQMPTIISLNGDMQVVETIVEPSEIKQTLESTDGNNLLDEKRVKTTTEYYDGYNNNVHIEYPVVTGMDDASKQEKINNKIKMNALSIVSLYPISTALQTLDINCEVKTLNDKIITIVYEGRVLGKKTTSENANSKSGSSGQKSSSKTSATLDPYLDGFVDPLAGMNYNQQTTINQSATTNHGITFSSNTAATTAANNMNVTPSNNQSAVVTQAGNANSSQKSNHVNTADKGPTVTNITAPTAAASRNSSAVIDGNYATNNPTSAVINSNTHSSSATYYAPSVPASNAPTSNSGSTYSQNAPVYGYTNTNTSASTIDQKIYFTNTIDLDTCLDLGLRDYVKDFEALAKYARSSKVEIVNVDEQNRSEVLTYIRKTVVSTLADHLKNNSDFRNEGVTSWPKHFSYQDEDGVIYLSIKLSSKLGNYAIIKYDPRVN